MAKLTNDFIAVDTNVLEHLLEPNINTDHHIFKLLLLLKEDDVKLLVDAGKKITSEYGNRFVKRIKQVSDKPNERILLKHWLDPQSHNNSVEVCQNDPLMSAIRSIILQSKEKSQSNDRVFVYVAFKVGRILITNDQSDIINEGTKKNRRRKKLLRISKRRGRKSGADILTSEEAHYRVTH